MNGIVKSPMPIESKDNNVSNFWVVLDEVKPDTKEWNDYLDMSVTYVEESWPEMFKEQTQTQFRSEYDSDLRSRLREGGRGLFFAKFQGKCCGLVNFYLDGDSFKLNQMPKKALYIAEFYIIPEERKKGIGKLFFAEILKKAREEKVEVIAAEVDKDKQGSNAFWGKIFPSLDASGERNLYWNILD